MIYENEIVMLVLGLGVLVFALANRDHLRRVPSFKVLIAGFSILVGAWVVTVLEGFFWEAYFNFAEHACYAASGVLVALWCWLVFGRVEESE